MIVRISMSRGNPAEAIPYQVLMLQRNVFTEQFRCFRHRTPRGWRDRMDSGMRRDGYWKDNWPHETERPGCLAGSLNALYWGGSNPRLQIKMIAASNNRLGSNINMRAGQNPGFDDF